MSRSSVTSPPAAALSLGRVVRFLQRWPFPWPARVRGALVRSLSGNLFLQAIGNLEGRDEFFWLRREAWAEAHRILDIDPSRSRFEDTGWEFGLETEIFRLIFRPLLVSAYGARRDERLSKWLDDFVATRWVDCALSYLDSRSRSRVERRRAGDIDRWMRGRSPMNTGRGLLSALSSALIASGLSGQEGVGLVVAGPRSLPLKQHGPALDQLRGAGVPVLCLALDADAHGIDPTASRRSWGLEVVLPLPSPEELIDADPGAPAEYVRLLGSLRPALRRVSRSGADRVPIAIYKWLAAGLTVRRVFDRLPVRVLLVLADKTVEARAFVAEARRRRVPSLFHYRSLDLGAPQYWPFTDRVLVSNGARAERLIECLGVPEWRIEAVGDREVDEVLREVGAVTRPDVSDFRLTFLLKWPAGTVFGPPEELLELLRAIPAAGFPWTFVIRPNPRDGHDYGWLESALRGQARVVGPGYHHAERLAETIQRADLVVAAIGNAAYCAIAAGKPTVIFNPNPKLNIAHGRLFARNDLPRHLRLALDRDALIAILRRVQAGEEPDLLDPEPLKPSLVRYLFHSLDGGTADRVAKALLRARVSGPGAPSRAMEMAGLPTT